MNYSRQLLLSCFLVTMGSLIACATDTPLVEPPAVPDTSSSSEASSSTGGVVTKKVVSLDLSMIPETLALSEGEVSIQPLAVYSDQSKDTQINISVDDTSILSIKEGVIKPLKVGKVHLFFSAAYDTNIRGSKTLIVTPQAVNNSSDNPITASPSPDPEASSTPVVSVSGVSSQEQKMYAAYFLTQYKVGMKWTYDVSLDAIRVSAYQASLPDTLSLGWGMVLENFAATGLNAKIEDYVGGHKQIATYTVEVLETDAEGVVLQTELSSNIAGIANRPLRSQRYTPDNIAEIYTGILSSSALEQRRLVLNNRLTFKESQHTKPVTRYLTDEIKMSASLDQGFTKREESLTWVNNQVGLVRKEVRQHGSQGDLLGVTTTLVMQLTALEGFE